MGLRSCNCESSVRNIPNARLESRIISKLQCLSAFRFELLQSLDLKVKRGSGFGCLTLWGNSSKPTFSVYLLSAADETSILMQQRFYTLLRHATEREGTEPSEILYFTVVMSF